MSFTSDVKQEISLKLAEGDEARAELSALIQMTSSLSISSRGMTLVVQTENAAVSRVIVRLVKSMYTVQVDAFVQRRMNLKKNLIYGLRIYGEVTAILEDLAIYSSRGLLDKPLQRIVVKDSCARAYLAGAFMAEGSVNSPKTSNYHLELKTNNESHAGFILDLLSRFHIHARIIERRTKYVVYVKQAEKIGDFLRCVGADNCLMQFEDARISRDFANSVQRLNNVDVANEVKSITAANHQLEDIRVLEENDMVSQLDEKLKDVIALRKEFPEGSLNELSDIYKMKTGIIVSKSGLKHRFVKIHELALKVKGKEDEK